MTSRRGSEGGWFLLFLSAFLIAMLTAGRLSAQSTTPSDSPAQGQVPTPAAVRIEELERRLRELAARVMELESADAQQGTEEHGCRWEIHRRTRGRARRRPRRRARSRPTVSQTGPISGYMDFHLNRPEHEDPQLDFHRFVLLFNHSFTDRLRFIGELELEHGAGRRP